MRRPDQLNAMPFEALFEASPNAYVLLDRELVIVGVNAAYLDVTQRSAEELIGRPMFEAFPSDPESEAGRLLRQSFARVLAEGRSDHLSSIRYPIVGGGGELRDLHWSATHVPLTDSSGTVAYVLQHTVDVTELVELRAHAYPRNPGVEANVMRRAAALQADNLALGEERSFLRQLFEQAPGFMAVLRGPQQVFELANAAYQQLIGHRSVVGLPARQALPELDGQGFFEIIEQVYRSGQAFIGRGMPAQLQREPGGALETVHVDFIVQPIRNLAGRVDSLFVQGHDITEQFQAQLAARESEARFRTLAHAIPNHVWTALPDGSIDWCNQQTLDYAGLAAEQLYGSGWEQIVHPEDRPAALGAWRSALSSGDAYRHEFRLRRHDGAWRWHLARASTLLDDSGAITRWIGTNTDIEDQKAGAALLMDLNNVLARRVMERTAELERVQEELRHSQKMEAIGNLAGGIAHDFNNLLQVVGGNLQLLSREVAGREAAELRVANALRGVARGARLAAQLLAFGRRQPLAPRVVNVGRLIRSMDEILRGSLGEAIEIDTVIAGGLWNTHADPANIENALLNLALNARDAMEGRGRLTIEAGNARLDDAYARAHHEVVPGQYVMVAVSDTGAGMTADVLDRVFDPFFTTKPEGRGTGLGLSMVYGFVKQSGGHVKIYSEPGRGTTVKLYLPRSLDAEDPALEPGPDQPETGDETILVVEDDDAVRETTVALLRDLGYRVLKARDAESAFHIVDSGVAIDLLFTDVVMPGSMEVTALVRKAKLRLPRLAVLYTSGYTESSIVHGGRLDAGVHLLGKPYTHDALARKIRQVLRSTAASLPAAARQDPGAAEAPVRSLHVVVCEDDLLVRQTIAELLETMDCEVAQVARGAAAREVLSMQHHDLLITDLGLPDENGLDLASWARASRPELAIAIVSGSGSREAVAQLPGALALPKPFEIDDLAALIRQVRERGT